MISPASDTARPAAASAPPVRLSSLDAYRGFVMLLMMGEVLQFCRVARALHDEGAWKLLCWHQSHVDWIGCSLHDLIQPSFSFLVGVALPFSIASRRAKGQSTGRMTLHAFVRALILILLGVFLRSMNASQTNWTFEDTLTQIGLGYGFLFLLGFRPVRDVWIAIAVLLAGYWAAFALYPLPPADFDYARLNVTAKWLSEHGLAGFAAHWQKNSNLAWAFDTWFLNLFSRAKPFVANGGGYATLSFIPTLATMLLGLVAGHVIRSPRDPKNKLLWFGIAGVMGLAAGWACNLAGICPVVKRIWTPSWVLFSGGWCFLLLAAFYGVVDVLNHRRWAFPLIVVGMNSIAAYCIAHLFDEFVSKNLVTHLGAGIFKVAGDAYEPFLHGLSVLLVFWLILLWMYRRKIFLRI